MTLPTIGSLTIVKTLTATGALAALATIAGQALAPQLPLVAVLAYAAVGSIALLAMLTVLAILMLTIYQWILRMGGTDTQWFWFSNDPRGLVQLRGQQKRNRDRPAQH
ncbi:MAG: hypothetical protein H7244_13575 [Herminiimonas sp.]|nr:hypothetical protein [Herminiimonas sp.]